MSNTYPFGSLTNAFIISGGGLVSNTNPLPVSFASQTFTFNQTNFTSVTNTSISTANGTFLDIPVSGQSLVGLNFTGLTAANATITYFSSIDATKTPNSTINSYNTVTGQLSPTRTTDGETRVPVAGRATLRLLVTSAGTSNVTISYIVTSIGNVVDIASPVGLKTSNSVTSGPIIISNTATAIGGTANNYVLRVFINNGTANVYIGNSSVTASGANQGYPLVPAQDFDFSRLTVPLYGISTANQNGSIIQY